MIKPCMYIIIALIAIVVFIVVGEFIRFQILIARGANEIKLATPFSRHTNLNATSTENNIDPYAPIILVAGDSTGYGTGAENPNVSIAGYIGNDFPKSDITNIAINGLKVEGLLNSLNNIPYYQKYNIIVLQIGGNDIVRLTNLDALSENLKKVIEVAKKHANHVFIMSCGSVGTAPTFSPLTSWLYENQTRKVREVFMKVVAENNDSSVRYIDLFLEKAVDPFFKDPKKYYSNDKFHPRGEGYAVWYQKLRAEIVSAGLLK